MLDLEAHHQSSIPHVHTGSSTVLLIISLFSNDREMFSSDPVYLASFEIELHVIGWYLCFRDASYLLCHGRSFGLFWTYQHILRGCQNKENYNHNIRDLGTLRTGGSLVHGSSKWNMDIFNYTQTHAHTHTHIYIYYLRRLKFALKHLNAPTCFDHTIILREHILLCSVRRCHAAQHKTHSHNQAHSKHRTTHTQKDDMLPQHQS